MKKMFFLLLLPLFSLTPVQGQKRFFVEASGTSWLFEQAIENLGTGINVIAGRQHKVGKFYIEPAIGLTWLQFETIAIYYYDLETINRHLYLNIPLKVFYPVFKDRFLLGAGISANVLAGSRHRIKWLNENTGFTSHVDADMLSKSNNGINNLYAEASLNLSYYVSPKWVIMSTYYHGLNSIYDDYIGMPDNGRTNRITVGLKYFFTSVNTQI